MISPNIEAALRRIASQGADVAISAAGLYLVACEADLTEQETARMSSGIVRKIHERMPDVMVQVNSFLKKGDKASAGFCFVNGMCLVGVAAVMEYLGHTGDAQEAADKAAGELRKRFAAILGE